MEEDGVIVLQLNLLAGIAGLSGALTVETINFVEVDIVALIESLKVALVGKWPVDVRVFRIQVGLVEVIDVGHVGRTNATVQNDCGVRADEHGNSTAAT